MYGWDQNVPHLYDQKLELNLMAMRKARDGPSHVAHRASSVDSSAEARLTNRKTEESGYYPMKCPH